MSEEKDKTGDDHTQNEKNQSVRDGKVVDEYTKRLNSREEKLRRYDRG